MINNATKGMTLQKEICEVYGLDINNKAQGNFDKSYDYNNSKEYRKIIKNIFNEIKDEPIELTTFTKDEFGIDKPYNFKLKSGKTLSIRSNKKGSKIAPRVVGQAGYFVLNKYFGDFVDFNIKEQNDIKKLVLNNIHKMLPIFIDWFFISDYTVWINETNNVKIIERGEAPNMIFKRSDLTFTRDTLESWSESTTLKYRGISIAEIQVHKERTFKFRFIMDKICDWLKQQNINNETLGMTAEKVICDIFSLDRDDHINNRSNRKIEATIKPTIIEAFRYLPKAKLHTGSLSGERGGVSKCSYDFILEDDKTLSLKTNYGKMVCPPEVGQPGDKTFLEYFGEKLGITEINNDIFKENVYKNTYILIETYLSHLLDSDYLLWVFKNKDEYDYKIINSEEYRKFKFDEGCFTFTRETIEKWNSSNTVKYKGKSLGEFQVHNNRNSYKFRFNMKNLLEIITSEYSVNEIVDIVAEL